MVRRRYISCHLGDTFPVGCAFSDKNVYSNTFVSNPDFDHVLYSSKCGIYTPNCGLDSLLLSFGHDEYLYQVLKDSNLPPEALGIIRFHSFYPWHSQGAYSHFMDPEGKDAMVLKWVREFNKYDLYSKSNALVDVSAVKVYYQELIAEFLPEDILW